MTFKSTFKLFSTVVFTRFYPSSISKVKVVIRFQLEFKVYFTVIPTNNSEAFVRFRSLGWMVELQNNKLNHLQKILWAENSL